MTSDLHFENQTTKKYGLPLSHLEYSYIEKCASVKELEKIVSVLRSGDEGKFPDLENFAEKRLEILNPKSHVLRKECPILHPGDLESGDWNTIEDELKTWTVSMHEKDSHKSVKASTAKCQDDIVEVDENLPPVRSTNIVLEGKKQKKPEEKKKKKAMPRDYKEWDKFDVEAEVKEAEVQEKKTTRKAKSNEISLEIDTSGMSEEEKDLKANREKDKGNEAFRSQDFEEAVAYYSRSISLMPIAASYNNRALAYLKLKKWERAIRDCNSVLNIEANNIKALMRRGTAYKSKKDFKKACEDLEKVLTLESNNRKAEDLLKEVKKAVAQEEIERKEKGGRRMVIEEVDSEDDEAEEEIEVDKPVVNGYGTHDICEIDNSSSVAADSDRPEQDRYDKSKSPVAANSSPEQKLPVTDNLSESGLDVLEQPPLVMSTDCTESELSQDTLPNITSQDNSKTCLQSPVTLSPASPLLPVETSALPSTETTDSSSALSQEPTGSLDSKPSFTLDESSMETSQAASPQPTSVPPQATSAPSTPSHLLRPQLVQLTLPSAVSDLKEEGNKLFRSGQYGEALEQYSQAILELEKESKQQVNLSVLLSNRAVCHLKTGNLSQTLFDCSLSLQLVPHGTKTLLRRAAAYEGLEKYAEAYVDYKHVISLDESTDQAHQGATRCQSMLQQKFGPKSWREKIPPMVLVRDWEVPLIVDQAGLSRSMSSTISLADHDKSSLPDEVITPLLTEEKAASFAEPQVTVSTSSPQQLPVVTQQEEIPQPPLESSSINITPQQKNVEKPRSKEQAFEDLKAKGNQHVQKGQYQEAAKCYSSCITLCPNQVACYTNRALCYLKLNKTNDAETDCDKALSLQADNPKALYRRALARKACLKYKLSLQDLLELLKLEPKNSAAQKEMDIVKMLYKEELEKLKINATAEQESKVRKRVKIEEVDDEEDEEKPRSKVSDKFKGQNKLRSGKQQQQLPGRSKNNSAGKKQSRAHETPVQGQPVAPPIAPRLMKTTPYEFCKAWNSLKFCQGIQPYADILRQISPVDLPSVISNKLDGQMLQIIVRCVYEEMVLKGDIDLGFQILDRLCHVPRFSTVSMFMNSKEKKEVSAVLDILSKTTSSAYTSADIMRLKKEYSVKCGAI